MPSLNSNKPPTPAAPKDMTIVDSYQRIDEFVNKNATVKQFKIEDDNHGMGMISTVVPSSSSTTSSDKRQAINMRLDQSTICNYLVNHGFTLTTDASIVSRK